MYIYIYIYISDAFYACVYLLVRVLTKTIFPLPTHMSNTFALLEMTDRKSKPQKVD